MILILLFALCSILSIQAALVDSLVGVVLFPLVFVGSLLAHRDARKVVLAILIIGILLGALI